MLTLVARRRPDLSLIQRLATHDSEGAQNTTPARDPPWPISAHDQKPQKSKEGKDLMSITHKDAYEALQQLQRP